MSLEVPRNGLYNIILVFLYVVLPLKVCVPLLANSMWLLLECSLLLSLNAAWFCVANTQQDDRLYGIIRCVCAGHVLVEVPDSFSATNHPLVLTDTSLSSMILIDPHSASN
jgi:hypothetical protein